MPLYMDIHTVPGVKARDVAEAHRMDLLHQHEFGCNCMTYWIDEERETIFCLIEAVNKDAVKEMHRKAHGLVPNKVIEVSSSVVQSFLGRIYDPDDAVTENGVKVFADPSFRFLLVTKTYDPVLLRHRLGREDAEGLMRNHNEIVRRNIQLHNGSEAEHPGEGFIASFSSASEAITSALGIKKDLPAADVFTLGFRLTLNGGEPIEKSKQLFGDTIRLGQYLCAIADPARIAVSSRVKELVSKELFQTKKDHFISLAAPDEDIIHKLFSIFEDKYHDPAFDVPEYSQALAMSQTQLYRKTTSLTGLSCNNLLKDFRLDKAMERMKSRRFNISQVTFDSGFASPSYFTKCFKNRFGLVPGDYIELLKEE